MVTVERHDSLFLRPLAGAEIEVADWQRARMLDGMARAVATKGYARVTVADVVSLAGVSRRTFYEQFEDKEDCFLSAYGTGSELVSRDLLAALSELPAESGWRELLEVGMQRYTAVLAADPGFARAFVIDVLGAGPKAVELRRRGQERFIDLFRRLSERAVHEDEAIGAVPDLFLCALVGGISELVQRWILAEGAESLPELAPGLIQLAAAVITGAPRDDVR
jgi:AcrR family transcriptional regulator